MEEIIFKPRYSFSYWSDLTYVFLMTIIGAVGCFQPGGLLWLLSWPIPLFVMGAVAIPFILRSVVRRIRFQQSVFVTEYYFRPAKEIEYAGISDMSEYKVRAHKYSRNLQPFSNRKGFWRIIDSLQKTGRISKSQFEGKLKKDRVTLNIAHAIASLGTILSLLTVPFILRAWYPEMQFHLMPILVWSFLAIFLIAFAVLKFLG